MFLGIGKMLPKIGIIGKIFKYLPLLLALTDTLVTIFGDYKEVTTSILMLFLKLLRAPFSSSSLLIFSPYPSVPPSKF